MVSSIGVAIVSGRRRPRRYRGRRQACGSIATRDLTWGPWHIDARRRPPPYPGGATAWGYGSAMIRFLLFRFLPRRIMPLLMLFEAIQLVRRLRRRDEPPTTPVRTGLAPAGSATVDPYR